MATQNKITEIIAAIKTIYPYYAKEADVSVLVKLWNSLLKDYPDNIVDVAFYKCLQTCKMPPTPADVIERIKALQEATEQTDEELWTEFVRALRKTEGQLHYIRYPLFGETPDDARKRITAIWDGLPERVKQYVGSQSELKRIAQSYTDDDLKYAKTTFLKTMPTIKNREETKSILLMIGNNESAFDRLEGGKG